MAAITTFKYMSFIRTLAPGKPYQDASAALNNLGQGGWELVSAYTVKAELQDTWAEVFYLKAPIGSTNSPP